MWKSLWEIQTGMFELRKMRITPTAMLIHASGATPVSGGNVPNERLPAAPTGAPHPSQNRAPARNGTPHRSQNASRRPCPSGSAASLGGRSVFDSRGNFEVSIASIPLLYS